MKRKKKHNRCMRMQWTIYQINKTGVSVFVCCLVNCFRFSIIIDIPMHALHNWDMVFIYLFMLFFFLLFFYFIHLFVRCF